MTLSESFSKTETPIIALKTKVIYQLVIKKYL